MSVRTPVEAMNVLEGTQSKSTHAPPIPSESISDTVAPYCDATSAASYPAGPPPMMTIRVIALLCIDSEGCRVVPHVDAW